MKKCLQIIAIFCVQWICSKAFSQSSCYPSSFQFAPSTANKTIDWNKFPDFNLPFTIIYGGPRFNDTQKSPLRHGFSHLNTLSPNDGAINTKNIAALWYGVAYLDGKQPWETLRSPWNNDLVAYQKKWKEFIGNNFNADILVLDIERQWYSNTDILQLKSQNSTPQDIKSLDNQAFINRYKSDLQKFYAQPFQFSKTNGVNSNVKLGSYADAPLYPSIVSIASNNWQKWTTDVSQLNFINLDLTKNTIGGDFYNNQNIVMPSAYYYYDYPNILAGDYLPYLLFMVEANKAWTTKPIVPFVWLKYDAPDRDNHDKFIKPFMAEASAIFPFMAGANGLWLWDNPMSFGRDENFSTYEYFIYGLYRLSLFKDMFDGSQSYIVPTPPNEYPDKRTPIWRGVAKGNEILIAAHNPYAKSETEVSTIEVSYKNWKNSITLKGYEVYLCKFDLSLLSTDNQTLTSIKVFPNPTSNTIQFSYISDKNQVLLLQIFDTNGKKIHTENLSFEAGENLKVIDLPKISAGVYSLKLDNTIIKKVIIQ